MSALKRPSKKGYVLAGTKAQVLLLHGFTGSPYDLHPLAHMLHGYDFQVHVPLLVGHGKTAKALHGVNAEDWLVQAQQELQQFDPQRPIIVGGLSMGALLAILLAKDSPQIQALGLFSPALYLGWLAQATIMAAQWGIIDSAMELKKLSGGSDIADPQARKKTPALKEMPLDGLLQFERLRVLALDVLPSVQCPTFVGFGKHDAAIDAAQSHRAILHHITAPLFCHVYDNSKHVITLDYDRDHVAIDFLSFVKNFVQDHP